MKSIDLLREFYYKAEQLVPNGNDEMLGVLNSAYVQIADDLEILDIILKHIDTDNNSLWFKKISSKRNVKDFEKIVKRLNNDKI